MQGAGLDCCSRSVGYMHAGIYTYSLAVIRLSYLLRILISARGGRGNINSKAMVIKFPVSQTFEGFPGMRAGGAFYYHWYDCVGTSST